MNENGILPKLVPRIYHTDEFVPFLEALDASFQYLEKSVKNLPDIVDVDNCDDKYLPYLAAGINCPLYGYNTKLWRKQIKNWPYVCRMKGTKRAIRYFLNAFGIVAESIPTYWRDQYGNYTEEKPEGDPFFDETSGLWKNSKTHYFDVILSANDDDTGNIEFGSLTEAGSIIRQYLDKVKPFHAELLRLAWIFNANMPVKIQHKNSSIGYINARHRFWNQGISRSTYWDGEFCFDGTIRFDGIYPDENYKERQSHKVKIDQSISSYGHVDIKNKYAAKLKITPLQAFFYCHKATTKNQINSACRCIAAHVIVNDTELSTMQNGTVITKNTFDGSFCFDGTHDCSGSYEFSGYYEHLCTCVVTKNNQIVEGSFERL